MVLKRPLVFGTIHNSNSPMYILDLLKGSDPVHQTLLEVAEELNIHYWWVEAVAVEYTECRDFAVGERLWTFDFGKVTKLELLEAVKTHRVVIVGPVMHNVHQAVVRTRLLERMVSNVPAAVAEHMSDIIPAGPLSDYCFPTPSNPLEIWDPKLSFQTHFQIIDNEQIWQWPIAELVTIEGQNTGKWVSPEVNLEKIDLIIRRFQELERSRVSFGASDYADFVQKVKSFYDWVDSVRRPILQELEQIHIKNRSSLDIISTCVEGEPPLLSRLKPSRSRNVKYSRCSTLSRFSTERVGNMRQRLSNCLAILTTILSL
ncbi:MAG: hypothetical protein ACYCX4_09990 [Bacillota bacterium]